MAKNKAKPSLPSHVAGQSVSVPVSAAVVLFAVGIGLGYWSPRFITSDPNLSPTPQVPWSLPTHSAKRNCSMIRQQRSDGGTVWTLPTDCFPNPWLSVHTTDVGMTPEFSRKLIHIANKSNKWYTRQEQTLGATHFGYTQNIRIDDLQLTPQDTDQLYAILRNALGFIRDHYWMEIPQADRDAFKNAEPPYFARLYAPPTIVKYDAAVAGLEAGLPHKDFKFESNSQSVPGRGIGDVSFIVLLSDPNTDFEGGGTWFEASDEIVEAEQGKAVFWCSQLYHGAATLKRGQRLAISAFTAIHEGYWNIGRSLSTATRVELY